MGLIVKEALQVRGSTEMQTCHGLILRIGQIENPTNSQSSAWLPDLWRSLEGRTADNLRFALNKLMNKSIVSFESSHHTMGLIVKQAPQSRRSSKLERPKWESRSETSGCAHSGIGRTPVVCFVVSAL